MKKQEKQMLTEIIPKLENMTFNWTILPNSPLILKLGHGHQNQHGHLKLSQGSSMQSFPDLT